MTPAELSLQAQAKSSYLCVGLDTDLRRIPQVLQSEKNPALAFNKAIIEATQEYAIAYKPNLAFYEAMGPTGWEIFAETLELIPDDIMVIADAKRGDIGNTAHLYARAFFETYQTDALTVAPYMGRDSVEPFLSYADKWVFLLGLTSNPGARDFQYYPDPEQPLYEQVFRKSQQWSKGQPGNLGFVVGATRPEVLADVRKWAPAAWLLVPGVGAQGGDLDAVLRQGKNDAGGLLINSSRGIIYASDGVDFAEKAHEAAKGLQARMKAYV